MADTETPQPSFSSEFAVRLSAEVDSRVGQLVTENISLSVQRDLLLEASAEKDRLLQEKDAELDVLRELVQVPDPDPQENTEQTNPDK